MNIVSEDTGITSWWLQQPLECECMSPRPVAGSRSQRSETILFFDPTEYYGMHGSKSRWMIAALDPFVTV